MTICRFFAKGHCLRGDNCPFEHPQFASNAATVRAASSVFRPVPNIPHSLHPEDGQSRNSTPVESEVFGYCVSDWKGTAITNEPTIQITQELSALAVSGSPSERLIAGATVLYQDGAVVSSLSLPSEFSTIQISGLPLSNGKASVSAYLAGFGFRSLDPACIQIMRVDSDPVVMLKVPDAFFAEDFLLKFKARPQEYVRAQILHVEDSLNASARFQMHSVSCSWFKPSKTAWLHYSTWEWARKAADRINSGSKILGRRLQANVAIPDRLYKSPIWSVKVGNIDIDTTEGMIRRLLQTFQPSEFGFGNPSYEASPEIAELQVSVILQRVAALDGPLEVNDGASATRRKAIAKFKTGEDARKVVQKLHGIKIPLLGDTPLFLSPVVSVKFTFLSSMYPAIRRELEELRPLLWGCGHVHTTICETAPGAKTRTLSVFGDHKGSVATGKAHVEKVLAGTLASNDGKPIWDPVFASAEGAELIKATATSANCFIYCDTRRSQLRLYGPKRVQEAVVSKLLCMVRDVADKNDSLVLDDVLLQAAMNGGHRRLLQRFGKNAARMTFKGEQRVLALRADIPPQEARDVLLQDQQGAAGRTVNITYSSTAEEMCVVCLCEPDDPLCIGCEHVYCRDCFINQCASIEASTLPLSCLGDSSNCSHVFSIEELQTHLPMADFEGLLSASFATFIKSHPAEYQYCPTPDCDQVYKATKDGSVFNCSACLTPICTTCHAIYHDQGTCEEYNDLVKVGNKAFEKWKRENDVRDCPSCKTSIEKTYGCNHMMCEGCSAHICWFCMDTFTAGPECYGHMSQLHGSFYEPGEGIEVG